MFSGAWDDIDQKFPSKEALEKKEEEQRDLQWVRDRFGIIFTSTENKERYFAPEPGNPRKLIPWSSVTNLNLCSGAIEITVEKPNMFGIKKTSKVLVNFAKGINIPKHEVQYHPNEFFFTQYVLINGNSNSQLAEDLKMVLSDASVTANKLCEELLIQYPHYLHVLGKDFTLQSSENLLAHIASNIRQRRWLGKLGYLLKAVSPKLITTVIENRLGLGVGSGKLFRGSLKISPEGQTHEGIIIKKQHTLAAYIFSHWFVESQDIPRDVPSRKSNSISFEVKPDTKMGVWTYLGCEISQEGNVENVKFGRSATPALDEWKHQCGISAKTNLLFQGIRALHSQAKAINFDINNEPFKQLKPASSDSIL